MGGQGDALFTDGSADETLIQSFAKDARLNIVRYDNKGYLSAHLTEADARTLEPIANRHGFTITLT